MPDRYITGSIEAVCKSCKTTNHITADHLSVTEAVRCSRCGTMLGDWDGLRPVLADPSPATAEARR